MEKGYFRYPTSKVELINCTGVNLELPFGETIIKVEASDYLLPTIVEVRTIATLDGVCFIDYAYLQTKEGLQEIKEIRGKYGKYIIIVGNEDSAKAYFTQVVTPADYKRNLYGIRCNPFVFKVYDNNIYFGYGGNK